jgi:hypothetical protein
MNIEERLYMCFKKAFEEYDGRLKVPLDQSSIVYDVAGCYCADEFEDEMYQRWLKEKQ